jgi:hypothetical protein
VEVLQAAMELARDREPRKVQAEAARVDWQWQAGEASDHIRKAQFRVPFEAGSVDQDSECGLLVGGSA